MNTTGDCKIPKHIIDQNTLEVLLENIKKIDTEQQQTKSQNVISILELVMSLALLVQEESNKHLNSIKFIYEELKLMIQNKFDYSAEIIFPSVLSEKRTGC